MSKEGRITLLGGLDVDPTKTGMEPSIIFRRQGVRQWEARYSTSQINGIPGKFILANKDSTSVFTIDDDGQTHVLGSSMIVGRPGANESNLYIGTNQPWNLQTGLFQGESMFELTDPMYRPRLRVYNNPGEYTGAAFFSAVSILGNTLMGSSLSVYGPWVRLGGELSVLRRSNLGSSSSVHSLMCSGSFTLLFGLARFGLSLFTPDFASIGSSLPPRGLACAGFPSLAFSLSRSGSLPSALDVVHTGSSPFLRSFTRSGFVALVLDCMHAGPPSSVRSLVRSGPPASAVDFVHLDLLLSMHSPAHTGPLLSIPDRTGLGSLLLTRSFA